MIIVNAGAYKSGSTWVNNILSATLPRGEPVEMVENFDPLPDPLICPTSDALARAIASAERPGRSVIKAHLWSQSPAGLSALEPSSSLRFINIERDLRDTLVSRWHHEVSAGRADGASGRFETYEKFEQFVREKGNKMATELVGYRAFWRAMKRRHPDHVLIVEYERLHSNYLDTVQELTAFCGADGFSDADALSVQSLADNKARFQKQWMPESFYRKGIIGDWRSHFTERASIDFNYYIELAENDLAEGIAT